MHRYFLSSTSKVRCRALLNRRTDTRLIARLCSGQPAAWAQLVDRWSPRLYSYIYYNTGEDLAARRLLHTILHEVIQTVITRPRIENLSVLIFSIAHRQILTHCRENRTTIRPKNLADERMAPKNEPMRPPANIDPIDSYFFHRFRQFPLETKQILLLRYVCGVTLVELSQIVGETEDVLLRAIERVNIYFQ